MNEFAQQNTLGLYQNFDIPYVLEIGSINAKKDHSMVHTCWYFMKQYHACTKETAQIDKPGKQGEDGCDTSVQPILYQNVVM